MNPIRLFPTLAAAVLATALHAEVQLPNAFTDHMVLQRDQANPIWGTASPNETLTISLAGNVLTAHANATGHWRSKLPPLPAGGPHTLIVSGSSTVEIDDLLVGEVWFCSGQSNMEWPVENSYGAEVDIVSANNPQIRLLTVNRNGTATPQSDIDGSWQVCSPETVRSFSAIGYYYGQSLNAALGVPIGLIDNAWGGSSAEAWVPRDALLADGRYSELMKHWDDRVETFDQAEYDDYVSRFNAWNAAGQPPPSMSWDLTVHPIKGQQRPSNIFNGMVHPLAGYGIKGVIWYQGESNSSRGEQHLHLFPLLVKSWRETWGQGDFPFYWVQLADFGKEAETPGDDNWAELRDSQTSSMDTIPNSGQAVIIDIGEGRDIHPRNKKTVASRLVRWPLAKDYGFDIAYQSPRYKSMKTIDGKIRIVFDHVSDGGLWSFDTSEVIGFSIAGEDRKWVWAEAKIVDGNSVEVWSDDTANPVAARYGWAMNPRVNLFDRNGLPVTPFRTDSWKWLSAGVSK